MPSERFLQTFAFMVIGALLVSVLASFYRLGTPTQYGQSYTICEFVAFKRQLANSYKDVRKVVFFGLSNVLSGIRSDIAESELGQKTINLGMVANLTNGFIFSILRESLNPGDTAVLILPYFYFTSDTRIEDQREVVRQTILDCSSDGLRYLPFRYWPEMLLFQNSAQTVEGVKRRFKAQTGIDLGLHNKPDSGMFTTVEHGGAFSHGGDWLWNDAAKRATDASRRIEEAAVVLNSRSIQLDGDGIRELTKFIQYAKKQKINVVAAWPTVYLRDESGLDAMASSISRFYEQEGVLVVGRPNRVVYGLESYFDSPNHLISRDAEIYTRQIVKDIKSMLPRPASVSGAREVTSEDGPATRTD